MVQWVEYGTFRTRIDAGMHDDGTLKTPIKHRHEDEVSVWSTITTNENLNLQPGDWERRRRGQWRQHDSAGGYGSRGADTMEMGQLTKTTTTTKTTSTSKKHDGGATTAAEHNHDREEPLSEILTEITFFSKATGERDWTETTTTERDLIHRRRQEGAGAEDEGSGSDQ